MFPKQDSSLLIKNFPKIGHVSKTGLVVSLVFIIFGAACGASSSQTQTETSPETESTQTVPEDSQPPTSKKRFTLKVSPTASQTTVAMAASTTAIVPNTTANLPPTGAILSFGGQDSTCASVKLSNGPSDADLLAKASQCFFKEFEAGKAVTVDIARPTVEGDPIFYRYLYNGGKILTIEDTRADPFGDNSVVAKLCEKVVLDNGELLAENCEPADSLGFPEALR